MEVSFLKTEIKFLKGVGPERAKALASGFEIYTFGDLLYHFPFRYIDRTRFYKINEIRADLPFVQFKAKVVHAEIAGTLKARRLVVEAADDTGSIEMIWFKGIKWVVPRLKAGAEYIFFGKASFFNGKVNLAHPEFELATEENARIFKRLQPVYFTGEKLKAKWLDSKGIWKLQRTLVAQINKNIRETLSKQLQENLQLISLEQALKQIHMPEDSSALQKAELRLKFEELFFLQLRVLQVKGLRQKNYSGFVFENIGSVFNDFYEQHLPFQLTGAQKKVLKEIRFDLNSGKQMNRLLQGDVGSGKTIVALLAMLIAIDNGFQACLMAPTEILSNQHFRNLSELIRDTNVNIRLLTGSSKKSERAEINKMLRSGDLNILVGTHALLEEVVQFKNLGLAVIDEQHKFGVAQRSKLWKKSQTMEEGMGASETIRAFIPPHILVMTATPIPRTLSMTLYGDLDVSVIDELPPGRKAIKTAHRFYTQQKKVYDFIRVQVSQGRQAYVVFPIISESEVLDYKNLQEGFAKLKKEFSGAVKKNGQPIALGMVHGQLKNDVKDEQMKLFVEGKTDILVATTVIEVGVDVPNASIMVIESAERFGLSQLHQLRGRVGRGAEESFCILLTDFKLSTNSKTRMDTMVRTSDGFEIAETDLRLRGPGDMTGTQQSGLFDFKIADIIRDHQILLMARDAAKELLEKDIDLRKPENLPILNELNRIKREKPWWGRIS